MKLLVLWWLVDVWRRCAHAMGCDPRIVRSLRGSWIWAVVLKMFGSALSREKSEHSFRILESERGEWNNENFSSEAFCSFLPIFDDDCSFGFCLNRIPMIFGSTFHQNFESSNCHWAWTIVSRFDPVMEGTARQNFSSESFSENAYKVENIRMLFYCWRNGKSFTQ